MFIMYVTCIDSKKIFAAKIASLIIIYIYSIYFCDVSFIFKIKLCSLKPKHHVVYFQMVWIFPQGS